MGSGDAREESSVVTLEPASHDDARDRFLAGVSALHTRHGSVYGRRAGFVVLRPSDDGLLIDHLYVTPDAQGQSIGAAVLARIFAEADERGAALRVGALKESDSNRFYERHGFERVEVGEWDNDYLRKACGAK